MYELSKVKVKVASDELYNIFHMKDFHYIFINKRKKRGIT
jgi:hypothetical protein